MAPQLTTESCFLARLRLSALPSFGPPSKPRPVATSKTLGSDDIKTAVQRLADAISQSHPDPGTLTLLSIADGGIELTRRLATLLSVKRVGTIDISFHRDDIGRNPIPKEFTPTVIPFDIHDSTVILIDDVLFSGRTAKAALDELFDHGRPRKVELAVLVDRGGRMLPIAADYTGLTLDAGSAEKVTITLDPTKPSRDLIKIAPRPLNQS